MVSIEELLEEMDEMLDKATAMPFSGGKVVVNADKMREIIDDIRLHLPQEIRQARAVVAERNDIVSDARKEAEGIIRKAEDKARALVAQEEITRKAKVEATDVVSQAQTQAREIRRGATNYAEEIMRKTEDIITKKLEELRGARQSLRSTVRNDATIQSGSSIDVSVGDEN